MVCSHIPKGGLVGGEYRKKVMNCSARSRGMLVEQNTSRGGAYGREKI
jgi:hypothetical protein